MRLAAISDIHGNIAALEAVLEDIERRGADLTVNLGDSLSGPFDAVATAERLIALNLPTVRGNHDRQLFDRPREEMGLWESWIVDDLDAHHIDWLRTLPLTLEMHGVLLCHATPASDEENWLDYRGPMNRLVPRDLAGVVARAGEVANELILCGHTHTSRSVRLPDGRMVVNPGAVGCPAYLDRRNDPPFIHQTGTPDAWYAIVESFAGTWRVEHHSVPYDSTEMAQLATNKGADSWAEAVTRGWYL